MSQAIVAAQLMVTTSYTSSLGSTNSNCVPRTEAASTWLTLASGEKS